MAVVARERQIIQSERCFEFKVFESENLINQTGNWKIELDYEFELSISIDLQQFDVEIDLSICMMRRFENSKTKE